MIGTEQPPTPQRNAIEPTERPPGSLPAGPLLEWVDRRGGVSGAFGEPTSSREGIRLRKLLGRARRRGWISFWTVDELLCSVGLLPGLIYDEDLLDAC